MTKIMPVLSIECGPRSCITRSHRIVDGEAVQGLRPCEWYRSRGSEENEASCLLFETSQLKKKNIGRYAFGVRCAACRTAERVFNQVQLNATQMVMEMHETMRDGLVSLVEMQEKVGKVALSRGG